MATYNFKKEVSVSILYPRTGGSQNRYLLDVNDISFSQTFAEKSYPVKTLHNQNNFFEASRITKANVASFGFAIPALSEGDFSIVETLLLNADEFDLFIQTSADIFRISKCVITNGTFVIERSQPLSIEIQGDGSRLQRGQSLTGTLQNRSATKTYIIPQKLTTTIDGTSVPNITTLKLELQNNVTWTPYTTVNGALTTTTASTTMYPSSYSISKKILSGSIVAYLTNINASEAQTWNKSASINVRAGNGLSVPAFRGFNFGPATCSFTNRVSTGDLFLHSYDWRMTQNPNNLANELQYITD